MTERPDARTASDEALVDQAQSAPSGDTRAFETLVKRHQAGVTTNCRFISRSPDDAEDLAQEVFVKAYFALARFEGRSSFKTWVQRIKVNHCLNFLRKKSSATFVEPEDPAIAGESEMSVDPAADRNVHAQRNRERIEEVLDEMTDTLRVPLIMRDLDGFSYEDIAKELGIGLSATKMRIKRAREEFQQRFGEDFRPDHTPTGDSE